MIPARIGQQCAGGTFTGFNRIRNSVYGIITYPKSSGVKLKQKTSESETPNTQSTIDGLANTDLMNNAEHPVAHYCKNLIVDGFNDCTYQVRTS